MKQVLLYIHGKGGNARPSRSELPRPNRNQNSPAGSYSTTAGLYSK